MTTPIGWGTCLFTATPPFPHSTLPSKLLIASLWSFHCFLVMIYANCKRLQWHGLYCGDFYHGDWKRGNWENLLKDSLGQSATTQGWAILKIWRELSALKLCNPGLKICLSCKKKRETTPSFPRAKARCQRSPGAVWAEPCSSSCVVAQPRGLQKAGWSRDKQCLFSPGI